MINDRDLGNLFTYFDVGGLRADARGVHDGCHVDAGASVEEAPEQAGQECDERLEQQDQRHPLVVVDVSLDVLLRKPLAGDRFLHRQVVRVAHPANGVGVHRLCKLSLCGQLYPVHTRKHT